MKNKLALLFVLFAFAAHSQPISYFNSIFLQQQNAAQDLAWLGIGGTNKGLGTVTNFTATGFPPLFSSAVSTPTTYPHLAFTAIPQGSNLVFASPDGVTGIPTFRRLTANDLPGSGGSGTVTSFSSGDLPPIFTTSVATPTTTPALSYTLNTQSANLVFAGPTSGGAATPTFRSLVAGDVPDLSGTYLPLAGGTMTGTINLASGGVNFGSSPMFQDGTSHVAIRNGTTAQSFSVYDTFTDSSNYRRGSLWWVGNDLHVGTESLGTGTNSGNFTLEAAGNHRITFRVNSVDLWTLPNSGELTPLLDNTYDIGDNSSPLRPRTIYAGTSMVTPGFQLTTSPTSGYVLTSDAAGVGTWQPAPGGGGGGSPIDLTMTNLTPFANNTNFYIDFSFPAQTLKGPGDIAFNYSTNWGLSLTSRVANVFVPATNYARNISFVGAATNWHVSPMVWTVPPMRGAKISFQLFGVGETNVSMVTHLDSQNAPNLPQIFNLASITTSTNLLFLDPTRGVYQDPFSLVPAIDGNEVRTWTDLSGNGNSVTNNTAPQNTIFYKNQDTAPYNLTCLEELPGGTSASSIWLKSKTMSITSPAYVFIMFYAVKGGINQTMDSLSGASTRILCDPGFNNTATIASQNTSSLSFVNNATPKWTLFTFVFSPTAGASQIRTNGVVAVSGTLVGLAANGITIGSDIVTTSPTGTTYMGEMQVWWGTLSGADLGNIETNYFRAKYHNW